MNATEVVEFLLPQPNDPLQVGFLALILVMMGFTIVAAHLTARPASWKRKWERGTPEDQSDDLEIDHGSVTDLWHAVATAPEKLAEVMPGMLLVVGLLGTFLGLGLALNHASNILGQPNALSASGAASSMQDLLSLLQGLGTKFKTSTWGITGFVFLKIWAELTRFEEKRLAWVISKVKSELEMRKEKYADAEKARQKALFDTIIGAAQDIVVGLSGNISQLIENDKDLQKEALQHFAEYVRGIREDLGKVHADTAATHGAMEQFTKNTQGVVEKMADASQRMAGGADKVGDAARQLVGAVGAFECQFKEVLDKVRNDLSSAIDNMSSQASETLRQGSAQLGDATREISEALGVLSADVKDTMGDVKTSINRALEIQNRVGMEVSVTTSALGEQIQVSRETIEKLGTPIKDGLASVAESGRHMRSIGKTLERSIESTVEIIGRLDRLPSALHPLERVADVQSEMILVLKPLVTIPSHQQTIKDELERLRNTLTALVSEKNTATPTLALGDAIA